MAGDGDDWILFSLGLGLFKCNGFKGVLYLIAVSAFFKECGTEERSLVSVSPVVFVASFGAIIWHFLSCICIIKVGEDRQK